VSVFGRHSGLLCFAPFPNNRLRFSRRQSLHAPIADLKSQQIQVRL
jgi:hypothetical protein